MYKNYFFLAFCILLALYFAPLSISAVTQLTIGVSRAFCVNNGTPLHLELKFNTLSMTWKAQAVPQPHLMSLFSSLTPLLTILASFVSSNMMDLPSIRALHLLFSLPCVVLEYFLPVLTNSCPFLSSLLWDPLPKLSLCPIVSIKYPCPFSKLPVLFLQGTFQFVNLYLLCDNVFDIYLPSYKVVSFISARTLSFILSITTLLHLAHVV